MDLTAGVIQYRQYKSTQYALQQTINELQRKLLAYMEKTQEVLSELENANVIGRLYSHLTDIAIESQEDPLQFHQLLKATERFEGQITRSAIDPTPDPSYKSNTLYASTLTEEQERLHTVVQQNYRQVRKTTPTAPASHSNKVCHRCGRLGHIRATCTSKPPFWTK